MNTEIINYKLYTRLPCNIVNKSDKGNSVLEVLTPHNGAVIIELDFVDKGMFRKATLLPKQTEHVIDELYNLENEAKNWLLNNWLTRKI